MQPPPPPTPAHESERKLVTVLFADLSGFTALAETLDPERVREIVSAYFEGMVPIIERYQGTVEKFIGDEIMALFGAPIAAENHPECALRAALEMKAALASFNAERQLDLGLHFGINTGLVIAGSLGTQGREQYAVTGDAVNLAARLRGAAERDEIFVGPDTYRLTAVLFEFKKLPPLKMKGKAEPVAVYRLLRSKATPGLAKFRRNEGLRSPLVGRKTELEQIQTAIHALETGRGGLMAIVAEAGLGKSRLVAEARQAIKGTVAWVEGRCLSYTEGVSYWVARDLLRGLIGADTDVPSSVVAANLRAEIERLFGAEALDIYACLGRLLAVPLEADAEAGIRDWSPEALRRRMVQSYGEFIQLRARERPLVLVWEDLHWADPSSLDLLEILLPLTDQVPLLVLLVFRPEEGRTLTLHAQNCKALGQRYGVLQLAPLTSDQSAELAGNLLRIRNLPETTRARILEKAEGNPFFVEELLRSLVDAGLVVLEADGATVTRALQHLDVPDTLQAVIAGRIDRLSPEHKRTLQTASVIGRTFQQRVIAHLRKQEQTDVDLDQALKELCRRELLRPRNREATTAQLAADREYIFKHVLTQEVTYSGLLLARRKALHSLTGEALELLFPDALDELAATLAYHFEKAEARDKAIHYLSRAAIRAKAIFANTEAIGFYRSALAQVHQLLHTPGGEAAREMARQFGEELGDVLSLTGKFDEARAAYQEALAQTAANGAIQKARLHRKSARVWQLQRRYEEAAEMYQTAERALGPSRPGSAPEWWREWVEIHLDRMHLDYWCGAVGEMAELAEKTRPILERYGKIPQHCKFYRGVILLALRRDLFVVSEETLRHVHALSAAIQQSENVAEMALDRFLVGFTLLWHGDLDEAESHLLGALAFAERTGNAEVQPRCLNYLTLICRKRGELERTRAYIQQTKAAAAIGQMQEYIALAQANEAWLAFREQNLPEAQAKGESSIQLLGHFAQGFVLLWVALWPLLGVAVLRKDTLKAIEHARALLDPKQAAPPPALASLLRDAVQAWDANHPDTANTLLTRATELARNGGYL